MDRKLLYKSIICALTIHFIVAAIYIRYYGKGFEGSSYLAFISTETPTPPNMVGVESLKDWRNNMWPSSYYNTLDNAQTNTQDDQVALKTNGDSYVDNQITGQNQLHLRSVVNSWINGRRESTLTSTHKNGSLEVNTDDWSVEKSNKNENRDKNVTDFSDRHVISNNRVIPREGQIMGEDQQYYSLIYTPHKILKDVNHPQYNRAFARNTMPISLLNWTPSADSTAHFKSVGDDMAWIYSAYLVQCQPPSVRLFAISLRTGRQMSRMSCHYLDQDRKWIRAVPGKMAPLKDNHMLDYSASTLDCPIRASPDTPSNSGSEPHFVVVTKEGDFYTADTGNPIPIQRAPSKPAHDFVLCFSPLHSNYNSTYQLVQSIELNQLLGVTHFYVYNFSMSWQTSQVLRAYQQKGVVTVLPWPLPHLKAWYYGQIAAINDCIYRNRILSRYVLIIDTDEFIIPNDHASLHDLMKDIAQKQSLKSNYSGSFVKPKRKCDLPESVLRNNTGDVSEYYGSFMFRCAFFAEKKLSDFEISQMEENFKLSDEQSHFFKSYPGEVVKFLKRDDIPYAYESRSKLIVRPETIVSHAIHKTVEHNVGYQTMYVQPKAALLHHYRRSSLKGTNTLDYSALKYKNELYDRMKKVLGQFPKIFPP